MEIMTTYFDKPSLVKEKVTAPCIECVFYKEERVGFLFADKELYCTHKEQEINGYDPVTGNAVMHKKERLSLERDLLCHGRNFIKK
jgi:hypothetical protein